MNLLLINHYAGTPALGMEYRPYHLAREWVREGHRVRIVAATFSHVRSVQPAPGDELIDGIEYRWLPTPAYAGNGFGRFRNIMAFLMQVFAQVPQLSAEFRPDAVIASSTYPMDTWVARRIARAAGAVLVHELHDLWPLSPIELSGMSPWHPFALICQSAENAAYRDSDAVVSMLPKVQEHVRRHGGDPSKLTIVPNGISPDEAKADAVPLRADVAQAIAAARAQQAVLVGYAGSMGEPNALGVLLDAARLLRERPNDRPDVRPIRFVLVGDGHLRAQLAQRIAAEGHTNVALLAPIPKAQVPAFLAAIDIAYIGWRKSPIYRFGIAPNKLMDYMLAGRAVLHSVHAANDPVAEAGCGLTVEPESPSGVAKGLRQLAALTPQQRKVLGEKGRAYVLQHHAWPALARRFLGAIERARNLPGARR